jgi:NhaP-type Na+/H+ and K+/H+ antiporter
MEPGPAETAILQWLAAAGAIAIAFWLGYVAHYEFGISLQEIRIVAAIVASTIGALLNISDANYVNLNDRLIVRGSRQVGELPDTGQRNNNRPSAR